MIGTLMGRAGEPILLEGYADGCPHAIRAVEFSLDNGMHWTTYPTPDAGAERLLQWSFAYTPEIAGHYTMLIRSIDEKGASSPEPAHVYLDIA